MQTLGELAALVSGEVVGDPSTEIVGAASVDRAQPQEICLVTSDKYLAKLKQSQASAAVLARGMEIVPNKSAILVDDVTAAFAKIVRLFRPQVTRQPIGISPAAHVSPDADIGDNVNIYPGATILAGAKIGAGTTIFPNVTVMENCQIGSEVQIFPNATLYENTIVKDRVILHAGVVLGAYGFGYESGPTGHQLSSQLGNVVIESDVEIGANTTVDRGTFESTVISQGAKIDNLVQIGHNCVVGQHNLLCAQVGIAGSCTTEQFVVMAGQVGLADHLHVGAHVQIAAKSGLMHDAEPGRRMFGVPARNSREGLQITAAQAKLPALIKSVFKLTKRVANLESVDGQTESKNCKENQAA